MKGIFLLSFLNTGVEPPLPYQELELLHDKLKPIIKDLDCDIVITNRACMPIGRDEFKKYLKGMIEKLEQMEETK